MIPSFIHAQPHLSLPLVVISRCVILGQPTLFQNAQLPLTPPQSSGSSARTVSTASDSSGGSNCAPAMTREDAKIIFNNVTEIAVFSDRFTSRLEEALGDVLDGGHGEDHVGALFLEVVSSDLLGRLTLPD